ncbi:hypothetical protein [Vibrio parahaemolyticus]|uniref:hypothetical protein n=1 Tax=Vibrio parahaemolyticus TaxID=670 RepID=UPI000A39C5AD|nr:hypothetical protein [Vibrio parahaemolyticus]OUD70423.1 hypothetical protein BTN34_11540 [Vibrio parahaemolyticus]OUD74166.1 hypothetical protein BTN60_09855 [Vibrio parahaemolyticus]
MAYHLHLNFENKEYFLSDGAWSTKETVQDLLLPISAFEYADEKSAWNAVDGLKSLINEVIDKVEIEWNDWMTQKPTIIYKEDLKLLISKLKEDFYVNSFFSYLDNKKISEQHKEMAADEFYRDLPHLKDEGWFNFS